MVNPDPGFATPHSPSSGSPLDNLSPKPIGREIPGGSTPDSGFDLFPPLCTGPSGNNPNLFSSGPVRYFDGVIKTSMTDLASDGFGIPWAQVRSWTNDTSYSQASDNGNGWVDSDFPTLMMFGTSLQTLAIVSNGTTARYFNNPSASRDFASDYTEEFFGQDRLQYSSTTGFTLTTPTGDRFHFDFLDSAQPGALLDRTDAYGNTVSMTYTSGRVSSVTRGDQTSGSTVETWSYSYVPSGANAGLLSQVSYARGVYAGTLTTVQKVLYGYYTDGDASGNTGDLKTATVEDASSNVLSTQYYRYYTSAGTDGFKDAL